MKKVVLASIVLISVLGSIAEARYTHSYYRHNGTYVNGYYGN